MLMTGAFRGYDGENETIGSRRKLSGLGPEHWKLDQKIEAALLKYSSPYLDIRAIMDLEDDYKVPVETIRSWNLGLFWAVGGTAISTFFAARFLQHQHQWKCRSAIFAPFG